MPFNTLWQNLRIGIFRFTIAPRQPLLVPAVNKGNMLRGGFGHAFRKLCCVPQCRDTRTCPLVASCPYRVIFEPSPPQGSERLSKNQDIPRPFIFRPPLTQQTSFQKDEFFQFELILIGRALEFLPYFVLSFRELAEEGLGLNRARCTLERVVELGPRDANAATIRAATVSEPSIRAKEADAGTLIYESPAEPIYDSNDQLFRSPRTICADQWIEARLRSANQNGDGTSRLSENREEAAKNGLPEAIERVTVRFLTPTFLRADGEIIRRPEFHHLFKRLRDRINALCTFYGDGALDVDFQALGKRAEKVCTIAAHFDWAERHRTSSRTHQRHELSGFIGEGTYKGDLTEFIPWLILAELVHVGKHAAWGNGWIRPQR